MSKIETYRHILRSTPDWDNYLRQESRLPGPRANIELAKAVAEEGDQGTFIRYLRYDYTSAPVNSPDEFLAYCGVLGLGKLLSKGNLEFYQPSVPVPMTLAGESGRRSPWRFSLLGKRIWIA